MIANGAESLGNAGKQFVAVMYDFGASPMHWFGGANHASAEVLRDPLMSQADAEQRNLRFRNRLRRNTEIARIFRTSRAGRNDQAVEIEPLDLFPRQLIVPNHDGCALPDAGDEVHQVVGERIVVVDDQRGHPHLHDIECASRR